MSPLRSALPVIATLVAIEALPQRAVAQAFTSVITQHPANAFGMKMQGIISYRSASGEVSDIEQIRIMGGTGGIALATGETFRVDAPAAAFPTFTSSGDFGSANGVYAYTNGGPGQPDRVDFSLDLHGIARTARVGSGLDPATLAIVIEVSHVLPAQANPGFYRWTLPALPDASTLPFGVSLRGEVNGLPSGFSFGSGFAGTTLLLDARQSYVYSLNCTLFLPNGTEGHYSTAIPGMEVAVTAVPEPDGFVAAAAGLSAAGFLLRRRHGRTPR
jgi:hypothetical protein